MVPGVFFVARESYRFLFFWLSYIYNNKILFQWRINDEFLSKFMKYFDDIIKDLTEIEKDVIIKKYKYGYSGSEIANMNGISRQAIYKTHFRALSKTRKLL